MSRDVLPQFFHESYSIQVLDKQAEVFSNSVLISLLYSIMTLENFDSAVCMMPLSELLLVYLNSFYLIVRCDASCEV